MCYVHPFILSMQLYLVSRTGQTFADDEPTHKWAVTIGHINSAVHRRRDDVIIRLQFFDSMTVERNVIVVWSRCAVEDEMRIARRRGLLKNWLKNVMK